MIPGNASRIASNSRPPRHCLPQIRWGWWGWCTARSRRRWLNLGRLPFFLRLEHQLGVVEALDRPHRQLPVVPGPHALLNEKEVDRVPGPTPTLELHDLAADRPG